MRRKKGLLVSPSTKIDSLERNLWKGFEFEVVISFLMQKQNQEDVLADSTSKDLHNMVALARMEYIQHEYSVWILLNQ